MNAMPHLINAATQLMRQCAENGILLGKDWGRQVCPLLHTLEHTGGKSQLLASDQSKPKATSLNCTYQSLLKLVNQIAGLIKNILSFESMQTCKVHYLNVLSIRLE